MSPPELSNTPCEFQVKARMVGKRIDAYLASRYPDYSRSVIQKVIDAGAVLINGQPTKASYRVRLDDRIRVWLPELADDAPTPEDIPLEVVYEDEMLTVINKPPGMVVHPAKGHWSGTLVNAPPVSLRHSLDHGRREPPGDRPPPRPRHHGTADRGQGRPGPPPAGAPIRAADDPQGIPRAGRGGPPARQRLHRADDRLSPDESREDGDPAPRGRWQGGRDLLRGPGAVPGLRPGPLQARDRADAPDPRPPGRTSATRSWPTKRTPAATA